MHISLTQSHLTYTSLPLITNNTYTNYSMYITTFYEYKKSSIQSLFVNIFNHHHHVHAFSNVSSRFSIHSKHNLYAACFYYESLSQNACTSPPFLYHRHSVSTYPSITSTCMSALPVNSHHLSGFWKVSTLLFS